MVLRASLLLLIAACARAAEATPPVVYADDNIVVRAAVAEAGVEAIHIGDLLTLTIELAFDPDEVQVETLDEDWFKRSLSDLPAVSLGFAGRSTASEARGRAHVAMQWQFQVVACPPDVTHCPGAKRYELPLAEVAYRLTSAGREAAANRSARFTPWPGSIDLAPSIDFDPGVETGIYAVIPGGAWPAPKALESSASVGAMTLAAGGILLASGILLGRRRRRAPAGDVAHRLADSRWERAANRLADDALDDDAWSDLLRRCLAWYCLDELGRNPAEWLRTDNDREPESRVAECRAFFLDVLTERGIETARRGAFRDRFARVTGTHRR